MPLEGLPLREELGERFGVPVFMDNDADSLRWPSRGWSPTARPAR